ncbi:MAG: DUF4252 domain-containing protein, partial [Bacteroidota bacterium]
ALLFTLTINAQTPTLNSFYEYYKQDEAVTSISIPGFLVRLGTAAIEWDEKDEMAYSTIRLLEDVKKVRILTSEASGIRRTDIRRLLKELRQEGFEDLITVRSDTSNFRFVIREKQDLITNLVIIAEEAEAFTLLSLKTKVHLDDLSAVINASMQNK